jgi:hypothetical protein
VIVNLILLIIIAVVLFVLLGATLAPLESLGWYAGWYGEKVEDGDTLDALTEIEAVARPPAR